MIKDCCQGSALMWSTCANGVSSYKLVALLRPPGVGGSDCNGRALGS